jgi:hypothetical protein
MLTLLKYAYSTRLKSSKHAKMSAVVLVKFVVINLDMNIEQSIFKPQKWLAISFEIYNDEVPIFADQIKD